MAELSIVGSQPPPPAQPLSIVKSEPNQPPDAGFFSTLFHGVSSAPTRFMDFLSGHPVEDVKQAMRDSYAARQVHKQRAMDAYNAGDYKTAAEQSFFGNVPFLGPALGAAADEYQAGLKGQASAHALEILGPALADPAFDTISDVAGSRLGVATGGAIKGTAQAAVAPAKIPYLRINAPFGNLAAGTMAGRYTGRAIGSLFGAPAEGEAIGTIAGAGGTLIRGAVQGARKALADKFGAEEATVPPPAGRIPPIVPVETAPAGKTPADLAREELTPKTAPASDIPTPEEIAQGQFGKSYNKLAVAERRIVDNLAEKFNSAASVQRTPPPKVVPISTVPQPPPAALARLNAGVTAPTRPQGPAPAVQPPAGMLSRLNSAVTVNPRAAAQNLFDAMRQNGSIPETARAGESFGGEVEPPDKFIARARETRATSTDRLADVLHAGGIRSSDLPNITADEWTALARAKGLGWPIGKPAQGAWIRDVIAGVRRREGRAVQ